MSKLKKRRKSVVKDIYNLLDENAPVYYAEAYKMLATNIEFVAVAQACKNIMVTSALENECKTNCAVNLSLALASYGKKICLVDCDLRKPSIHRLKRTTNGLTHVLKGEVKLDKALTNYEGTNLELLLAGMIPPNPTELLASKKMQTLVEELAERFDYVIYDTPPCLGISDVSVLGRYMDATILAVKHDSTEKKLVSRAKSILDNAGIKVIGAVLTEYKANTNASDSYYSYSEYYYGEDNE